MKILVSPMSIYNIQVSHEHIRVANENIGVFDEAGSGVSDEMGSPMGLR